jgi:nucleoside-diphosphate-sugar epimerase
MQINDGRVVSNFIVQALENNDITIYGDGTQTRSFCFIDDLTNALLKLFYKEDLPQPINIGNPEEIRISELANEIITLTESKSKIVYKPLPIDDPMKRKPDIDKAKHHLDWAPIISRTEGLEKTINYFREKLM